MAAAMAAYTESLSVDARMVAEDIWGSQAHALMLAECGLLDPDELRDILTWLERARADFESGAFELRPELEDVHMNVERYVTEGAGAGAGGRLHTARSRNDQVLTDCRLYVRRRLLEVRAATLAIVEAMLARAATETETVMPGYTHSQHAQPITFGFWASAHASAWLRDLRRLAAAYDAVNRNPLGACALAGTDLPIDRGLTTDLLGFAGLAEHALDATSSRDFLLETTSALTLLMLGLSRLSEELVWWSSHEFRLIELDDAYTSGSSIMPQKKNPDCAELTRGKAARVVGDLVGLMAVTKSVSFGYSRDLQEDKPPVWDALDQTHGALVTLTGAVRTLKLRPERMRELVDANFAVATQLANWLVADRRVPFRQAHEIVGALVGSFSRAGRTFADVATVVEGLAAQGVEAGEAEMADVLDPLAGVRRQASQGGPSPAEVQRMIAGLQADLAAAHQAFETDAAAVDAAQARTAARVAAVVGG